MTPGPHIWIAENRIIKPTEVIAGPRVGIDYAGEDAKLPWRFRVKNNPYIGKCPHFNL